MAWVWTWLEHYGEHMVLISEFPTKKKLPDFYHYTVPRKVTLPMQQNDESRRALGV